MCLLAISMSSLKKICVHVYDEMPPHTSERLTSKRLKMTNVGKDVEEREPFYSVDDIVNWYSTKENSVEVPKKLK